MAIRIVDDVFYNLPETSDSVYIIPYAWLCYGLDNKHVIIEDLSKFSNTIQGSVFLTAKDYGLKQGYEMDGEWRDAWLVYYPGTGEAKLSTPYRYNVGDAFSCPIQSSFKNQLYYANVDDIRQLKMIKQQEINHSIIQLMKGCRVKLVQPTWNASFELI